MSPELTIILGLVFLYGVFALAEVAIVHSRRARMRKLAAAGNARARLVLKFAAAQWRFVSALRFGMTLACVMAGAVVGRWIAPALDESASERPVVIAIVRDALPLVAGAGCGVLFFLFGDVFMKRLAHGRPERLALSAVRPISPLVQLAGPLVGLLTTAADRVLGWIGLGAPKESSISDEEVSLLFEQGMSEGVFHAREKQMVEGVLALDRLPVVAIMTPRPKIVSVDLEDADEVNWRKIVAGGHSYFPAFRGSPDQVVGMLSVKALWANSAAGFITPMRDLTFKPMQVPESMTGVQLLEAFKRTGRHVALVTDEFGTVSGLVTLIDVLEAIVGDMPARGRTSSAEVKQTADGSWVIDATMPLVDLKALIGVATLPDEGRADYQTLGGFVLNQFGRLPQAGESFRAAGYRWEVAAMDRFRVDRVLIGREQDLDEGSGGAA